MKVAFLATDMVEQVELTDPWGAVEREGWTPELVSLEAGSIQGVNHFDKAGTFTVDRTIDEASADDAEARLRRAYGLGGTVPSNPLIAGRIEPKE